MAGQNEENDKSNPNETIISKTYNHTYHKVDFEDIVQPAAVDRYCNVCGENSQLFQCSHCKVLWYCSKSHQVKDWSHHKTQCMVLAYTHEDVISLKGLSIPESSSLIDLSKPFSSLHVISNWHAVWSHLFCTLYKSDIFQVLMSELLSWSLILANSISKFKLDNKNNLQIHILGANESYIKLGLFTYLLQFFPLPDTEIFLIGPQLRCLVSPIRFKNSIGKCITVSCISDVFDQKYDNFGLPDLIIAYHPDICDENYDWKPTLLYIVSKEIPSVFTMSNKDDFYEILCLLSTDLLSTNIIFKGSSSFPSMLKRYNRARWNQFRIEQTNSYWVGFQGDVFTNEIIGRDVLHSLSELSNLSVLELDKLTSSLDNDSIIKLGKGLIPSLYQFHFSDALKGFNAGLMQYDLRNSSGATKSFQDAISKSELPKINIMIDELKEEKKVLERKLKSVVASSYMYLGLLSNRQKNVVNAINELKKAIAVDESFHVAYYNLGVIYQEIGDFDGMEEAFLKSTKLSPKDSLSWNGLADAYYGKAKFEKAKAAYEHVKKLRQ